MSMVRLTGSKDHHQKMYQQWFNYVDSDGDGRITSDEANKFFAISNIQNHQLKQVCAIADSKCQGFLGFKEFITAMQLLSLAQAGHELNADFLKTTFDAEIPEPPVMKGLDSLLVLLQAYGTLMGLHGKYTPGVTRAYIGSFSDKPINEASVGFMGKDLFEKEQDELLKKLIGLPKEACSRRRNKFYDRAEAV